MDFRSIGAAETGSHGEGGEMVLRKIGALGPGNDRECQWDAVRCRGAERDVNRVFMRRVLDGAAGVVGSNDRYDAPV